MKMDEAEARDLHARFANALFLDVIPFWLKHGLDRENGGYFTGLARNGELIESDKSVWFQGRMAWVFSTLYADFRRDEEYLEAARLGIDFLEAHCHGPEGKMLFRVTREGEPLVLRKRYWFSESFAILAHAAFARASGDASHIVRAREILAQIDRYRTEPGLLEPKWDQSTRPSKGFAEPMILLAMNQELRRADPANAREYDARIDGHIAEMLPFVRDDLGCVLEQTGPKGEFQDHFEGRQLNPGHAIEASWFLLAEGRHRESPEISGMALKMLDWMWGWGWDGEGGGGIIYFRDALRKPPTEYWQDMKFWWPQNEAVIASLMAYAHTGKDRYAGMFRMADAYVEARFRDREEGEWYGYLHRDGSVATTLKGNMYKGCFHVPRMYMKCLKLLEEIPKALAVH